MTYSSVDHKSIPAPRWAVRLAWLVPVLVLPSAVWRAGTVFDEGVRFADGGWYPPALSVLSIGLALLTVGLVYPWGERVPAWVPLAGGRQLPTRAVAAAAVTGAVLLIAGCGYYLLNSAFGFVEQGPVLVGEDMPDRPKPGADVMSLYAPLLLWGPVLLAIAVNYRRRQQPQV